MSERLARLPDLTAAELHELGQAITTRLGLLEAKRSERLHDDELRDKALICRSLLTAIMETLYSVQEPAAHDT